MEDIYGVELSPSLISRLTERIIPRLEEWQSRVLSGVYTIIWLDCVFYRVRERNKVISKAVYKEYAQVCVLEGQKGTEQGFEGGLWSIYS